MPDHDGHDERDLHREDQRARRERSTTERDERTGSSAAATRIHHQARWVDLQIERAMARGEFDNLAGAGKPLKDLGSPDDRDWWLKKLVERERITGVLPPALQLRKDDAELDGLLDRETTEDQVRQLLTDFNRRVVEARRQLQGGPPVVTPTRDVEHEVAAWAERLRERRRRTPPAPAPRPTGRRRWWQRREVS
ncbi:DnaJ family domain-containing protein [Nocardioides marmoraquaticus]